jgi:hypothetical protein
MGALYDHTKQDQDDAFGFRLFVWAIMKRRLEPVLV